MPEQNYTFSFRCYFPNDNGVNFSTHYQQLALSDVPRWIEAYRFTHPTCISISVKVWFNSAEDSQV